jgi:hypothetical protein
MLFGVSLEPAWCEWPSSRSGLVGASAIACRARVTQTFDGAYQDFGVLTNPIDAEQLL